MSDLLLNTSRFVEDICLDQSSLDSYIENEKSLISSYKIFHEIFFYFMKINKFVNNKINPVLLKDIKIKDTKLNLLKYDLSESKYYFSFKQDDNTVYFIYHSNLDNKYNSIYLTNSFFEIKNKFNFINNEVNILFFKTDEFHYSKSITNYDSIIQFLNHKSIFEICFKNNRFKSITYSPIFYKNIFKEINGYPQQTTITDNLEPKLFDKNSLIDFTKFIQFRKKTKHDILNPLSKNIKKDIRMYKLYFLN